MKIGETPSASYATGGPHCSAEAKAESVRRGTRYPEGGACEDCGGGGANWGGDLKSTGGGWNPCD